MRRVAFALTLPLVSFSTMAASTPAADRTVQFAPADRAESRAPAAGLMLPDQLEAVFMSACFAGAVKLDAGQESPISLADLPSNLRRRFGNPQSGEVWRLNSSAPTYLYILNFRPDPRTSPKVCGLATESIKIEPAIRFLGERVNGPSLDSFHENFAGAEWLDAEHGYVAVASSAESFTLLEVKQLTREQQQRALKIVPRLAIAPPSP